MSETTQNAWEKYPAALPKDTILAGKYIIKDVLGQGGFGITYLAEDYKSKVKTAVKEYFPETMAMRGSASLEIRTYTDERSENFRFGMERFLEEAKVLAQFQGNLHIVGVQKYFEENGTAYFVMDYIEGTDFKTYIKQNGGKLPWEDVWKIMSPIMEALETVHKKGLVHRDVTPDNIIIAKDGTVKLLDFGAARYSLGDRSKSLDVVLKPGYAPKEQYTRRGKQGPFTDVYSVAACFYASLSGYLPPESLDRMEEDNLVPLSARGVHLPNRAEEAILKALEVRAEDRYQSMEEFHRAISEEKPEPEPKPGEETESGAGTGNTDAAQDTKKDDSIKSNSKKRKGIVIGAAAAVAVIAVVMGIILSGNSKIKDGYNTYTYEDGSVYAGEWKNGKINGQGVMTWKSGTIYEGEWLDGEPNGQGTLIRKDGETYEGEWLNGDRSGHGKGMFTNGNVYEGEWKDDKMNGQGIITYAEDDQWNRQSYEGEWQNGERTGQGTMIWKDGETYEGEWLNGNRSGYGKDMFTNGNVYEGEWKDDEMNGQGIIAYAEDDEWNRQSYEGEWQNGERTGQGIMIWKNGTKYEGEWLNGSRGGSGKQIFADGRVYEGEWKDGEMSGQGTMTYASDDSSNRESYVGEWLDSKGNGHGIMTWKSGIIYEGEWKDGKMNGQGTMTYASDDSSNRESYVGEWLDSKRNGYGIITWKNGTFYEGEWENGGINGHGKTVFADGSSYEGEYKDSQWDGYGVQTKADGSVIEGNWKEGKFVG